MKKFITILGTLILVVSWIGCGTTSNDTICLEAAQVVAECTDTDPAIGPFDCSGDMRLTSERIVQGGCETVLKEDGKADGSCNALFEFLGLCKSVAQGEGNREYIDQLGALLPPGEYHGIDPEGQACTVGITLGNFLTYYFEVDAYLDKDVDPADHTVWPMYQFKLQTRDNYKLVQFDHNGDQLTVVARAKPEEQYSGTETYELKVNFLGPQAGITVEEFTCTIELSDIQGP